MHSGFTAVLPGGWLALVQPIAPWIGAFIESWQVNDFLITVMLPELGSYEILLAVGLVDPNAKARRIRILLAAIQYVTFGQGALA